MEIDLPPPYSEVNSFTSETTVETPKNDRNIEQFRRYIIEIMAFTFGVDMTKLNPALGMRARAKTWKKQRASTLFQEERNRLYHLSYIIKRLHRQTLQIEWIGEFLLEEYKITIREEIVKPARSLDIREDYALDLISTYADHQCDPARWKYTLLARWSPRGWNFWKWWYYDYLAWALESHANLIGDVVNGEVRLILGQHLDGFRRRRVFRCLKPTGFEFQVRKGFEKLELAI